MNIKEYNLIFLQKSYLTKDSATVRITSVRASGDNCAGARDGPQRRWWS